MQSLYLARIEELGQGDFVKVDRVGCHHVALLTQRALLKLGLNSATKVVDLRIKGPVPWMRCQGPSYHFGEMGAPERVKPATLS
jgi:hypothetical protein